VFGIVFQATAQENFKPGSSGKKGPMPIRKQKESVPSVIKTWQLTDQGAWIRPSELDTALTFYHLYLPFEQNSISTNFTGNNGGAYQSNDFLRENTSLISISSAHSTLTPCIRKLLNISTQQRPTLCSITARVKTGAQKMRPVLMYSIHKI
jgi:hypothetical protein